MKAKQEAVFRALATLETDGRLTAELVVKAAKPKTHPLHDEFEWKDDKAAHEYRIQQARTLIRSVRLIRGEGTRVIREIAYVRDQSVPNNQQGYISVPRLRTEEENAREAVLYEFSRACGALARAQDVAACLGLEKEIAKMSKRLDDLRAKVEEPALV